MRYLLQCSFPIHDFFISLIQFHRDYTSCSYRMCRIIHSLNDWTADRQMKPKSEQGDANKRKSYKLVISSTVYLLIPWSLTFPIPPEVVQSISRQWKSGTRDSAQKKKTLAKLKSIKKNRTVIPSQITNCSRAESNHKNAEFAAIAPISDK